MKNEKNDMVKISKGVLLGMIEVFKSVQAERNYLDDIILSALEDLERFPEEIKPDVQGIVLILSSFAREVVDEKIFEKVGKTLK